jgi:hypothetical protein
VPNKCRVSVKLGVIKKKTPASLGLKSNFAYKSRSNSKCMTTVHRFLFLPLPRIVCMTVKQSSTMVSIHRLRFPAHGVADRVHRMRYLFNFGPEFHNCLFGFEIWLNKLV